MTARAELDLAKRGRAYAFPVSIGLRLRQQLASFALAEGLNGEDDALLVCAQRYLAMVTWGPLDVPPLPGQSMTKGWRLEKKDKEPDTMKTKLPVAIAVLVTLAAGAWLAIAAAIGRAYRRRPIETEWWRRD